MERDQQTRQRRQLRLQSWDYSWPWWYYVTICTKDRVCELGQVRQDRMVLSNVAEIAEETWRWLAIQYDYVELDDFVIMPNHLHGIIIMNELRRGGSRTAPTENIKRKPLGRLIGAFKTVSAKRINEIRKTPGAIFWQRSYHDHIIRNAADLHRIRSYMANNPLQWAIDQENPNNRTKLTYQCLVCKQNDRPPMHINYGFQEPMED
ncbi:MAG: transposase [Ignavibacteria bacterium]|nr:transposase [Ignavibacteria bacterium]